MKIVFLVKSSAMMHYFVNIVHECFPVAHIVQEAPPPPPRPPFARRARAAGLTGVARASLARAWRSIGPEPDADPLRAKVLRQQREILGARAAGFPTGVPVMRVPGVNDAAVRDFLHAEQPDAVLVQGTSIVRDATLPGGATTINMHAGLSPYYRGGACTEWALANWDPYNIGVTLHRLTERPDAGPIIVQGRVVPTEDDTSRSIDFKLTREGSALAVKVLERLDRGIEIQYHPQDLSQGRCYLSRHRHPELAACVERIDREGLVADILRAPSTRARWPIVEWREREGD